jgi:DNA helicase-2/ATP-dependent DNA helicase PcrA
VDEFQDTNRLQYQWLKLLSGGHNAIFAVGDDDQSIYTFRGASARNMFEFEREFAKGRVIKLEQNYRSQGNILDAANALIGPQQQSARQESVDRRGRERSAAPVRSAYGSGRSRLHRR